MPTSAIPIVQIDAPEVRITQWRLPPGSAIGHHRHEYDYAVVPMTDGELTIIAAEGTSRAPIRAGQAYFRKAGVEHDVINAGDAPVTFVEIELKRQPG